MPCEYADLMRSIFILGGLVGAGAVIGGQIAVVLVFKSMFLQATRWLTGEWRKVVTGES